MKKIVSIIFALFLITSPASAIDGIGNFTIGVSGNYSGFYGYGTEREYDETGGSLETTTTKAGVFTETYPSVFFEYDVTEVFSAGIEWVPVDIDSPTNVNTSDNATTTETTRVSVSFENYATMYALARIPFAGLYVKAGYSVVDIAVNETTRSGNTYPDTDTTGYTLALGVEMDSGPVKIRLEVAGHSFDDVSVTNNATNKNEVSVSDMMGATGRISIAKSF
jgi:hypothetical protein